MVYCPLSPVGDDRDEGQGGLVLMWPKVASRRELLILFNDMSGIAVPRAHPEKAGLAAICAGSWPSICGAACGFVRLA
jgi:hypothetical protein